VIWAGRGLKLGAQEGLRDPDLKGKFPRRGLCKKEEFGEKGRLAESSCAMA